MVAGVAWCGVVWQGSVWAALVVVGDEPVEEGLQLREGRWLFGLGA